MRRLALVTLYLLAAWFTISSLQVFAREFPVRDFGAFYASVQDYWRSGFLYTPRQFINLNPPHLSVLLFSPLLLFSARTAAVIWFIASAAAIVAALWLLRAELHLSGETLAWVGAVLFASSAVQQNWRQGQLGAVLLLLGILTWRAARHGSQLATAWWLAVAVSLKPWLIVWMVTQPRRNVARAIAIGATGVVAGLLVFGLPNWIGWWTAMGTHGALPAPSNVSLFGLVLRLSGQRIPTDAPAWPGTYPVWLALSVFVVGCAWKARSGSPDRAWLLWGLTAILISPIGWTYYLLVIVGPLVAWGAATHWPTPSRIALLILIVPWGLMVALRSVVSLAGSIYAVGTLLLWISVVITPQLPNSQLPNDWGNSRRTR